jgi:hypothetical protein
MPYYKKNYKGKKPETEFKKIPKYIQISDYDYVFACELLNRMGVEFAVIPTNENDKDYLAPKEKTYGLS